MKRASGEFLGAVISIMNMLTHHLLNKDVWMWYLGMCFSEEHGGDGVMSALDELGVVSKLNDAVILPASLGNTACLGGFRIH